MQIDSKTILTGLFASPSAHSVSPIIHNNAFEKLGLNYVYLSFEVNKDNLKDAVQSIKTLNMRGVNLSMPNKKEVIQYLDEISETAKLSQSVNTIVNDNGILKGYSTDGKGFFKSLEEEKIFMKDKNILKRKIEESDLLINATSVGMKENISLIEDKSFFRKDLIVSDIIYNPSKTKLLQIAEKEGCKIINGIGMLLYQGALSFELWTNEKMPVDYIKEIIFNYFK